MRAVLASTSWDATAASMLAMVESTPRRTPELAPWVEEIADVAHNVNRLRQHESVRYAKTAIIGAGPTGLSVAYHLGHDAHLFDMNPMVGGSCRSFKDNGFTFDYPGHIMSSDDPYVLELYDLLLGSNVHWQVREAWVYSKNVYTRHEAQTSYPSFGYPLRGGSQALMSGFVPNIKGTIELNAEVIRLSPKQRTITLADGRRYQYEHLISTMALPELVRMAGGEAPEEVRKAALGLQYVSARYVTIGVARENITDMHSIHYPGGTVFHRIFVQGNASPECNAAGGFCFTCEISYSPELKPVQASGQALIDQCVRDCIKAGLIREDDRIIAAAEVDMPYAYVVDDHARAANVDIIKNWLSAHDIVLAGCYSEWVCDSDHAFIAGKRAAEAVSAAKLVEPLKAASAE
jgi:protoporphyrinogen oxidase